MAGWLAQVDGACLRPRKIAQRSLRGRRLATPGSRAT
jgi:hypothetical protein